MDRKIFDRTNGVIVITGAPGSGKTTTALSLIPANEFGQTVVFDFENSTSGKRTSDIYKDIKFIPIDSAVKDGSILSSVQLKKPVTGKQNISSFSIIFDKIIDELSSLKDVKNIVFDTGDLFAAAVNMETTVNALNYGYVKIINIFSSSQNEATKPFWLAFINELQSKSNRIIFTSHLKNPWTAKVLDPTRVTMRLPTIFYQIASLMLWMKNSPNNKKDAIVLKSRIEENKIVDGFAEVVQLLPPVIRGFSAKKFYNYIENGYDNQNPKQEELITKEEHDLITAAITLEQFQLMLNSSIANENQTNSNYDEDIIQGIVDSSQSKMSAFSEIKKIYTDFKMSDMKRFYKDQE